MEKKELKWYETPAMEIVELETSTSLLAVSVEDSEEVEF